MEDFDTTPVDENESECPCCAEMRTRVTRLEVQVADLTFRRRVSRDQVVNLDPEWY